MFASYIFSHVSNESSLYLANILRLYLRLQTITFLGEKNVS